MAWRHFDGGHHHGVLAFEVRAREAEFESRARHVADRAQFGLETGRCAVAAHVAPQVFGDELGEVRMHEIGQATTKELAGTVGAAQLGAKRALARRMPSLSIRSASCMVSSSLR
jgi:hypothetical protein